MDKYGFVFAGQGAQYAGMGSQIAMQSKAAADIFRRADEILGFSISELCFKGTLEDLTPCAICQPAIYTVSMAFHAAHCASDAGSFPEACGGLSLGEYAAASVAGVFEFETGLKLVAERGRLMDQCCKAHPGGMAAVIGADPAQIEEICRNAGVDVANYNCPGQIVISGEKAKLEVASQALAPISKRVIPLTVAGAYHSRLMAEAAENFASSLDKVEMAVPKCRFVQNVTGGYVTSPNEIRRNLKDQITSSVRWEQCARAMMEQCTRFLEFGPGNVLSGFIKRIDRSIPAAPAVAEG